MNEQLIKVLRTATKKKKNNGSARARRRAMERALNKHYGYENSQEGQGDGAS